MIKVAINGFGRIGRVATRVWLERKDLQEKIDIVAINTSGSLEISGWAHLLKHDTSYGTIKQEIKVDEIKSSKGATDEDPLIGHIRVSGKKIPILAQRDPEKLPWKKYQVDLVLESTGVFRDEEGAGKHLKAGAKKVLISAPAKGGGIGTHVLGVNEYQGDNPIADNASCTTNCVAPVAAVIHNKFKIKKATLTTIHGYTDDQKLQDGSHKDLRRSRAAAQNIVPTTTGAAKATTKVIPELQGLFEGLAIRVPVITGSISDLTFLVETKTTPEGINKAIKEAADSSRYKGIIAWTEEPIVSSDIVGMQESTLVDLSLTQVVGGDLVKIMTWYDNEWGYSNRLLEQAIEVGTK
ncbi:type I glyceraldehyde-3-phosphate dehydrogenase [Patescibacteria group bacterium]